MIDIMNSLFLLTIYIHAVGNIMEEVGGERLEKY